MDEVGKSHKQLGEEAYYWVMINAHITCLTLNILQKSDGRTWKQTFEQTKIVLQFRINVKCCQYYGFSVQLVSFLHT